MHIPNRVGLHSERCNAVIQKWAFLLHILLTFGKQHKMGCEEVGSCGIGIINRKLAIIFQSRVVILNSFLLVIRQSFVWQEKWVAGDWKSGVLFIFTSRLDFFLPKNKVYLHEQLSSLHKTQQTHKPRLIAGNSIIQLVCLMMKIGPTQGTGWIAS